MTHAQDDIPAIALAWHRAGRGAALATVAETWGSAPRRVGSQLVAAADGAMQGSVSGGCVEGAVVLEAIEAISDGQSRLLTYGVSDDSAFAVGLACGGTIRVLVEPVGAQFPEELLAELVAARAERNPVAYVVDTQHWTRRLAGPEAYPDRFRAGRSGFDDDGQTFVAVHTPPVRLFVVGAVHIAQALVPMAKAAGYGVTLIDPRDAFATAERFADVEILADYPDEVLAGLGLDAHSAVVTLSHDPKIDDPAIVAALRAEAAYIGALGSTRTHAKRVERLRDAGFSEAQIARVHGPVGLDIGAQTPAEIAISIIAEMTRVLRRR